MAATVGLTWALITGLTLFGCTDKNGPGLTDSGGGDGTDSPDSGSGDGGADGGTATDVTISVSLDADVMDECRSVCGTLTVTGDGQLGGIGWQVESSIEGFLDAQGQLDADGLAEFCIQGPLTPGTHDLAFHVDVGDRAYALASIDVKPFGWAYGLDKPLDILARPDWVPEFTSAELNAEPVFSWQEDTWTEVSVLAPSTAVYKGKRFLYFAGTPDTTFYMGVASSTNDVDWVIENGGQPILTAEQTGAVEGDWDYYAQNTPEAMVIGDELWLYYNGRSGETGGLNIGLAISTDGVNFDRIPQNPVLAGSGVAGDFDETGIAHPSVERRDVDFTDNEADATEVFEMWYASGTLEIGYAISPDGISFERYCDGSVFGGESGSWDAATVKAPEVKRLNDRYYMTYSGCGQGCYQVGWAASNDGIRWAKAADPIIPVQEAPKGADEPLWNSYGTQEAFIEIDGDGVWSFWYAGTGNNHGAIGVVDYEP